MSVHVSFSESHQRLSVNVCVKTHNSYGDEKNKHSKSYYPSTPLWKYFTFLDEASSVVVRAQSHQSRTAEVLCFWSLPPRPESLRLSCLRGNQQ